MIRYIAFTWDSSNASACAFQKVIRRRVQSLSAQWTVAQDVLGLFVAFIPTRSHCEGAIPIEPNAGVVLGTLFRYNRASLDETATRVESLTANEADALRKTRGRSMCATHWGSYVLFLRDLSGGSVTAFRGPVGSLACFYINCEGVTIYFSSVDDCLSLRCLNISINWDCIIAQAASGDYVCRETGLKEITSVLSGEAITHSQSDVSKCLYWSPRFDPTATEAIDFPAAVSMLRSKTRLSVNAWSSLHHRVLLQLSGGFDSSVVLSCIQRAPNRPELTCVNFFSRQSGDERRFARSMSDMARAELVEEPRDLDVDLRMFFRCARTATPVLDFSACDSEPVMIRMAHAQGATAIICGELGDNIFGRGLGAEVLTEYVLLHGARAGLLRTALAYSYLNRTSIVRALRDGISYMHFYKRSPYLSPYLHWKHYGAIGRACVLTREAMDRYETMQTRFVHPWLLDKSAFPPGRIQLIGGLQMATSPWSHSPFGGSDADLFLSPLASQPLVDAFMSIPAHFHIADGEDGAVARAAFREDLPQLILQRGRGKGSPILWIRDVIAKNRRFLSEALLDGELVRAGILDGKKLRQALSGEVSKSQIYTAAILEQLYIEGWLSRWAGNEIKAAA
jgi:asparagine synthase (glutamine-hydrolysing)